MNLIKGGALLLYAVIRGIPFLMTSYFVLTAANNKEKKNTIHIIEKILLFGAGLMGNAAAFLGMHYYQYKEMKLIGYIKNVWGLNFLYEDVVYFIISAIIAIFFSTLIGVVLKAILSGENVWKRMTKTEEKIVLAVGLFSFVLIMVGFEIKEYYNSHILFNEVCVDNKTHEINEDGLIGDYVELYNSGLLPCKLNGLYLSDDKMDLKKLSLDGLVIAADGVAVVPCIGGTSSFGIDNNGEVIFLSDSDGNILQKVEVEEIQDDTSYAINDKGIWETMDCTPGIHNDRVDELKVNKPLLSHESGFYDEAFNLEITCDAEDTVYYTLDGSIPDEGSYLYEDPIYVYDKSSEPNVWRSIQNVVTEWKEYEPDETLVDKAFIIRAVAIDLEGNRSEETVATYFIDKEQYADTNVVSLIATPYDLFSNEYGIYVTGQRYDDWYLYGQGEYEPSPHFESYGQERAAIMEIFSDEESALQQNVGIRIQGGASREKAIKRFSIYAREEYDDSDRLHIDLFNRGAESHSVLLRDKVTDVICQELVEDRGVPILRGEPATLFLNGEHWYDRYIREKYSKQYFEDYYGIEKDNLVLFKGGNLSKGVETDKLLYDDLYAFAQENDFTDKNVYEEFCQMVDVSNYIDVLAANIYCLNMDVDDKKNVVIWRSREATDDAYSDGRWRWAMYDMDALEAISLTYYEVDEVAAVNAFSQKPRYAGCPYNETIIYKALRQNENFCEQFVVTCMDLMNVNFSEERVAKILDEYGADMRWGQSFLENRSAYMKEHMAEEFELTGTVEMVTIQTDEEKGTVTVNTITPTMKNGSWSGEYFTDYPITVTANPKEGYQFIGWSGDVNSKEASLEVEVKKGGITLVAEYEKIN